MLLAPIMPFAGEAIAVETAGIAIVAATDRTCAQVYDETRPSPTEIDPKLAAQIGKLAGQGVTVHIQIWDGAKAHGIDTDPSLENAVEDRVSTCAWKDDSSIVLTFVRYTKDESDKTPNKSVGKLNVRKKGPIDSQISSKAVNDAKPRLSADIKDPSEPIQADIATYIATITSLHNPQPEQIGQKPTSNEFDWSKLGLAVLAIGAVGVGIAGGVRGKRIHDSYKTRQNTVSEIFEAIDGLLTVKDGEIGTVYKSGNPLDIDWGENPLTERDDPGLESMLKEKSDLDTLIEELRKQRNSLAALAKPWSGATIEKIEQVRNSVTRLLGQIPSQKNEYLEARAATIEAIASAPNAAQSLATSLKNFDAQIDNLEQAGWDVSTLRASRDKSSEAIGGVTIAMNKKHFIAASNQAKEIAASLRATAEIANSAETTFTENTTRHKTRATILDKFNKSTEDDQIMLGSLQERFDTSCTEHIGSLQKDANKLTAALANVQAELTLVVAEKSFKALDEVAQKTGGFTSTQVALEQKRKELAETIALLEKLAKELPDDVSAAKQLYEENQDEAKAWNRDVDEEVIAQLTIVGANFEKIQAGLQRKKPAYFDLKSAFDETNTRVDSLIQTAREHHEEADRLRSDISAGNADAEDELAELRRYVNNHDDASDVSTDIDLESFSTAGSRKELQEELKKQTELRDRIARKMKDAKRAVREAEEERERLRLAAIAAAEAEHRRQQEEADRLRRDEEDRRRRQEEASRPSHDTGDLGGSPASHNTGDL